MALKAAAQAWLDGHPTGFEATYKGTLSPASSSSPSLYNGHGAGEGNSFGIRFTRPIAVDDTVESLEPLLDFVTFERMALPGLDAPEGWTVTGNVPCSSFKPGADGQTVTIDGFDRPTGTLRWTVSNTRFYSVGGRKRPDHPVACDRPMPKDAYFEIRKEFRGTLHFACGIEGLACGSPSESTRMSSAPSTEKQELVRGQESLTPTPARGGMQARLNLSRPSLARYPQRK